MNISMTINGKAYTRDVEPRTLLVHFLREQLGLTDTNLDCDTSQCDSCMVRLDDRTLKSCMMLAAQADGAKITTIEWTENEQTHPMQARFWEKYGLQCGHCTPGIIRATDAFLEQHPSPTEEDIRRHELEGSLCRCTGYQNIVAAILRKSGWTD